MAAHDGWYLTPAYWLGYIDGTTLFSKAVKTPPQQQEPPESSLTRWRLFVPKFPAHPRWRLVDDRLCPLGWLLPQMVEWNPTEVRVRGRPDNWDLELAEGDDYFFPFGRVTTSWSDFTTVAKEKVEVIGAASANSRRLKVRRCASGHDHLGSPDDLREQQRTAAEQIRTAIIATLFKPDQLQL